MTRDLENPVAPERHVAIVRDAASLLFFEPNRPPTGRERLARRRFDSRAPCPCRPADESAGRARSHAAGRPRSADTPREGWSHMPRLLSNAPGRSFSRPLFFHRRGARETARRALDRRSAARASPTGPARQPRDPAPAPLIDTPSLTDPTPAAPPPRRAANSDRAVVQGTSVESRHRNASWRVTACLSRESLRENKPLKKRFARRVGGHFSSSDERTRRTRALLFRGGVVSVRGSWTV